MIKKMFFILLFSIGALAQSVIIEAPRSAQVAIAENYEAMLASFPERILMLSDLQRKKLLDLVRHNEVASLSKLSLYDPPQNGSPKGEVGYCYGRAMAAHLIARKMGLAENSIKKIFAAGDMQNGETRWRFHVATVVAGDDGRYYVIDPILPERPLLLSEWIEAIERKYENTEALLQKYPELAQDPRFTGGVHFYLTDAEAIMVDMREIPAHLDLESGQRIIEILFDPLRKSGFRPVYKGNSNQVEYFEVTSLQALRNYFMILDEHLDDQFNFFKLDATIFYFNNQQPATLGRHYIYNGKAPGAAQFQDYRQGYFPTLLNSILRISERF